MANSKYNKSLWIGILIVILLIPLVLWARRSYFDKELEFEFEKETFITEYDKYDLPYLKLYDKVFNYLTMYKHDIEEIILASKKLKSLKTDGPLEILDAGTGVGKHYKYLTGMSKKVVGVDISEKALHLAKLRNPTGNFIQGNLEMAEMFKPNRFDIIVSLLDSMYHCSSKQSLELLISNYFFWLKPGGLCAIHIFKNNRLDPGPREFTQYYFDKKNRRHALTYFDTFEHDALWRNVDAEGDIYEYIEEYRLKNGKKMRKVHRLCLPKEKEILGLFQKQGFELFDIIPLKKVYVLDHDIYLFKKPMNVFKGTIVDRNNDFEKKVE